MNPAAGANQCGKGAPRPVPSTSAPIPDGSRRASVESGGTFRCGGGGVRQRQGVGNAHTGAGATWRTLPAVRAASTACTTTGRQPPEPPCAPRHQLQRRPPRAAAANPGRSSRQSSRAAGRVRSRPRRPPHPRLQVLDATLTHVPCERLVEVHDHDDARLCATPATAMSPTHTAVDRL